jgi:hypothetical protein
VNRFPWEIGVLSHDFFGFNEIAGSFLQKERKINFNNTQQYEEIE